MTSSPAEACLAAEARVIPDQVKGVGLTRCFVYTGSSMRPTFHGGQLLYVRPMAQDVAVGDVVVFADTEKGCVVHRVIAVTDEGLITRGDNNRLDDSAPIPPEHVIGRVEMVGAGERLKALPGGRRGLRWVQVRRELHQVERWLRRVIGAPYRALYNIPAIHLILTRFLFQHLEVGRFETPVGPVFKFIRGGKVIARWATSQTHPEIERPYDLFIYPDDLACQVTSVKRIA